MKILIISLNKDDIYYNNIKNIINLFKKDLYDL